jgi:hypothetical protein
VKKEGPELDSGRKQKKQRDTKQCQSGYAGHGIPNQDQEIQFYRGPSKEMSQKVIETIRIAQAVDETLRKQRPTDGLEQDKNKGLAGLQKAAGEDVGKKSMSVKKSTLHVLFEDIIAPNFQTEQHNEREACDGKFHARRFR